ncbi:hypothetical protein LEP48_16210 [Isoptericola sp. NEAU-Y5]|uniref:Uncharacterized protein n=1 Tax=Isoptericola luteus TaxID=2879484 RepID=A0ABS7ZIN4_9MICO|nr:hypothetical protein [Isoptericola sp. NEAU-Y5]MCA5894881.1 hypothetical protein [Isoptericola sp. NEAU-Y5]
MDGTLYGMYYLAHEAEVARATEGRRREKALLELLARPAVVRRARRAPRVAPAASSPARHRTA